jgi:6-hydroxy-3-succinoylpyridine 3-monooxygenase
MVEPTAPKRLRSIVYVDGFNLYNGAIKGSQYKWLNLERYFHLHLPNDDVQKIRYFTARIVGPRAANQDAYLAALATLPSVDIILGKFKAKQVQGRCAECNYSPRPFFSIYEEKRTDVNIALAMLNDAHKNRCDRMVLVSGDSDLVPAVAMVKTEYPSVKVNAYVPARTMARGAAVELRNIADCNKTLPLNILAKAQFPSVIATGAGATIRKPANW